MMKKQNNPFPRPSPYEAVLLNELVDVARRCYQRGWSWGTAGNFSLRGKNGMIWQSPTGLCKGELNPKEFIPVDLETMSSINPCSAKPSGEMPVHVGIFRAVESAITVVHTHPQYLVELSREGKNIQFQGEEMQKHLGCHDHLESVSIPVVSNPTPEQMPELSESIAKSIDKKVPMIVLAAHGVYAWGKTPMEAISYIEAAEFLCKTKN
jgi:methylthioribulose-1-phosphate dehydratase